MKNLYAILYTLMAVTILVAMGCGREEEKASNDSAEEKAQDVQAPETQEIEGEVVARVNGRPIYRRELRKHTLEEAILDEILYQEGVRLGKDKQFQKKLDDYKKRLVVTRLRTELLDEGSKDMSTLVTTVEIEEYYNQNEQKYTHLIIKKISVNDKGIADDIRSRLIKGEDLNIIESEYTDSGIRTKVKNTRPTNKYDKLFPSKEEGEVSEIIEDDNRFTILKIESVKKLPLDQMYETIKRTILAKRKGQLIRNFAENAKEEQNIEVKIYIDDYEKKLECSSLGSGPRDLGPKVYLQTIKIYIMEH